MELIDPWFRGSSKGLASLAEALSYRYVEFGFHVGDKPHRARSQVADLGVTNPTLSMSAFHLTQRKGMLICKKAMGWKRSYPRSRKNKI